MLSVIIIAKDEEDMIGECLLSVKDLAGEIVLVDSGSTDKTIEIAKQFGSRVIRCKGSNFSEFRNEGLKAAKGEWVFYIDADERITPLLSQEIGKLIDANNQGVYEVPRKNIYLGREMHFGGWGNDKVVRLYYKKLLHEYHGELHEQPIYDGPLSTLKNNLIHYSHRDLESMLEKTIYFTDHEAHLRLYSDHPAVVEWRFLRVMLTEFWYRFIKLQAWRDGPAGIIDSIFQVFNMFVIYARLWELQSSKNIPTN